MIITQSRSHDAYAKHLGFKQLGILGSGNNQYLGSERNPQKVFTLTDAMSRYDEVAERNHLVYDPKDISYYMPIK